MMPIANTIGPAGGTTTYVYPDSDGSVRLSITASSHWHVKVEQVAQSRDSGPVPGRGRHGT